MLQNRLRVIIDCIDHAHTVADIGCDHGYAAKKLIDENRARRVIACDISEKSLEKAARLVRGAGLEPVVETRRGDGLAPLENGEADVLVIAGVGGLLIEKILTRDLEKAWNASGLVLSPHNNEAKLRRFLMENGFVITDERLALEGRRYYQVICAAGGNAHPEKDDFYYYVGRKLIENKDENLSGFLRKEIARLDGIMKKTALAKDSRHMEELRGRRTRMAEVLQCL
jgi:tRNA (adenine22-N1)-methyltransferase